MASTAISAAYNDAGLLVVDGKIQDSPRSIPLPNLAEGERWAGIQIDPDGSARHLILLPGEHPSKTWKQGMALAEKAGEGIAMPTRRQQSLLFANLPELFQHDWYWSCEQHAGNDASAWMQLFGDGNQFSYLKGYQCRVVLVRSIPIESFSHSDDSPAAPRS